MKKRAILFGMFHYNRSASITANDLPSTEIDVKTLEKRLKQLQFETVSYMDLCLKDMEQKITEFADTAPCDSLNVVYFSGHGGHSKGENYLYPVDFGNSLDARMSIEDSAFNLKRIQPLFKRKVKLLIIVDACRDKLKPDYACNYSEMVAPQDTYIAYATQFGDCSGCTPAISYFTEALCDNILTPNISVDRLFTDVRATLYLKHGRQISNSVNGFMSDISLNEQADHDKVGNLVLQFVDHYGDMYVDKYGPFAGDDLVFIDAAQYCGISVLDAIYKFQKLDAERCHVTDSLSESHKKLICNDQCQEAKYLRQGQSFGAERHSERATVSVTGIGHSDIRGLVTDRSMVRRERCRLIAWIAKHCTDIVFSQIARTVNVRSSFGMPSGISVRLLCSPWLSAITAGWQGQGRSRVSGAKQP